MRVAEIPPEAIRARLQGQGLWLRTGPVVTRIQSELRAVADGLALHYARHPVEPEHSFADFHVSVGRPSGLRRWVRPQVVFRFDGEEPFAPLPGAQGFPLLEWGMNWCIYTHCHQFMTLHSAVLERGGLAVVLPAPSGSGKSTLCAGLAFRGWRLLSDELAVFDTTSLELIPVPRPISLKNRSIDVMRDFAPQALFSPPVPDTVKGTVAHLQPPADAVARAPERARPRWLVLPRYQVQAEARLDPVPRARMFMALVANTFNYSVHGAGAFERLAQIVERCECYEFTYSRLDDAVATFDRLAAGAGA